MEIIKGVGRLFYIIHPNETSFEKVEDIPDPDFVTKAIPYFFTFIFLEYVIQWKKNQRKARLNDGIVSLSHGMYLGCIQLIARGLESYVYIRIYENWRVVELPWDSPFTWYTTALAVDFGYYWLHRAAHEINFFWAQHQVHHSSEDYNLTTALRQSAFQGWIGWIFYIPLAFFIPPSVFLIHQQFNLLYQFWIHTEVIHSLGPLEYILNTPKHHRIHHGSNRYCLDKNYAGVLIIWDRMFGTFAEEKPNMEIIYGLVEDVKSFNPFWLQTLYYPKMYSRMKELPNLKDKLSVALKGPGWTPGKQRLGDNNDVPESPNREKFDTTIPSWQNYYTAFHFLVLLIGFNYLSQYKMNLSQTTVASSVVFILVSLTSLGFILEKRTIGNYTEILRNTVALIVIYKSHAFLSMFGMVFSVFFVGSIIVWTCPLIWSSLNNEVPMYTRDAYTSGKLIGKKVK